MLNQTKVSLLALSCALATVAVSASATTAVINIRDQSFDSGWRFLRADAPGAEAAAFDDSNWRPLDVPHDWSIEDLPPRQGAGAEFSVVPGQWRFHAASFLILF